jgi:hypothetical protein
MKREYAEVSKLCRGLYLPTSIWVPQDIGLSKVTMRRQDDNIEHHWDCSEKLFQGGWIRGLEKVQEKVDSLMCTLSTVAPTFLQTKFLEPECATKKYWYSNAMFIFC